MSALAQVLVMKPPICQQLWSFNFCLQICITVQ